MREQSRVLWDYPHREAYVVLALDIEEAEGIADALGESDGGAREIRDLVSEARRLEAERLSNGAALGSES